MEEKGINDESEKQFQTKTENKPNIWPQVGFSKSSTCPYPIKGKRGPGTKGLRNAINGSCRFERKVINFLSRLDKNIRKWLYKMIQNDTK